MTTKKTLISGHLDLRVIAIETSGMVGSVAVCEDSHCVGERSFEKGMRHGQALLPSLKEIFSELSWRPEDTDLIAVSHGPGSFTGLRIGITCAKTLAYVLEKPLVAVPTLDVLAENVTPGETPICPILDAKRKAVYACIYKPVNGAWERQTDFMAIEPHNLTPMLPKPVLIFGDGIPPYQELFQANGIIVGDSELGVARARVVARLGIQLYKKGGICDPFQLQPLYLRRPEAEEKWEVTRRGG